MSDSKTPERMTEEEYALKATQRAKDNHIWLNAFSCISPTPEFKMKIGEMVLDKLNSKDCLMPSSGITSDLDVMRELAELTPVLYIKINKS